MKNMLIKDFYPKKNEPQFSNFSIVTIDNYSVKISGNEVIDNILRYLMNEPSSSLLIFLNQS